MFKNNNLFLTGHYYIIPHCRRNYNSKSNITHNAPFPYALLAYVQLCAVGVDGRNKHRKLSPRSISLHGMYAAFSVLTKATLIHWVWYALYLVISRHVQKLLKLPYFWYFRTLSTGWRLRTVFLKNQKLISSYTVFSVG